MVFAVVAVARSSVSPEANITDIVLANCAAPFSRLILPMTGNEIASFAANRSPFSVLEMHFHPIIIVRRKISIRIHQRAKKFEQSIMIFVISGRSPPRSAKVAASVGITFAMTTMRTTMATQITKIGYVIALRIFSVVL